MHERLIKRRRRETAAKNIRDEKEPDTRSWPPLSINDDDDDVDEEEVRIPRVFMEKKKMIILMTFLFLSILLFPFIIGGGGGKKRVMNNESTVLELRANTNECVSKLKHLFEFFHHLNSCIFNAT